MRVDSRAMAAADRPATAAGEGESIEATRAGWRDAVGRARRGDADPRLLVRAEERPYWPAADDVKDLVAGGLQELVIAEPVRIGDETAETALAFVRFLRDCETYCLQVRWQGRCSAELPVALLSHLQPPSGTADPDVPRQLRDGRWDYAYGRCYWRAGPGFVCIRDTRPGRSAQRLTLADEDRRLFVALQTPARIAAYLADGASRRALSALADEGIVLRLGGWAVSVPSRMRHWPIPCTGI